jgi:hypothetical protein
VAELIALQLLVTQLMAGGSPEETKALLDPLWQGHA